MIIVEGPDGAGKTRLVRDLLTMFSDDLVQGERNADRSQLWKTEVADVWRGIAEDVDPSGVCRIWDRFYYSALIYHKFHDRECSFSMHARMRVTSLLRELGAVTIYCRVPLAVCMRNCEKSEQHSWVHGNTGAIWSEYENLHWPGDTLVYDYTLGPSHTQIVSLQAVIRGHLLRRRSEAS